MLQLICARVLKKSVMAFAGDFATLAIRSAGDITAPLQCVVGLIPNALISGRDKHGLPMRACAVFGAQICGRR